MMCIKKSVKSITFIIFLSCLHFVSWGESPAKFDSLFTEFQLALIDSVRFQYLEKIQSELEVLEKESEIEYWETVIEYCEKINYNKGLGFCNYNIAKRLKNEDEFILAIEYYDKCQKHYKKCRYKKGLAEMENGLGILYKNLGVFEQSVAHYTRSRELFSELNDSVHISWIYLNLGSMLVKQDSLEMAKDYLRKAQYLLEKFNDNDIISCYINLGIVFNNEANYDSTYFYLKKSYELSKNVEDLLDKFQASYHLGEFLLNRNELSEAAPILFEAKTILENPDNANLVGPGDRADFMLVLSDYYIENNDSTQAYKYLNKHLEYDTDSKVKNANLEYISSQLASSEEKRKKSTYANAIALSAFLFSLLFLLSLYRNYKNKQRANRLLTEMDELKSKMFSNITHEFRTPLTLILSPLEQMLSSDGKNPPSRKQVKMMRKNAKSLLTLVNQMLDLSKIDAKSLKLELTEKNVTKFLRVCFANFASLAEQKSIQYKCTVSDQKEKVFFDATKLEKIVNNLVSNSIKFTPKNGQISCSATVLENNTLELIIKDTGKGIPRNELKNIFDRFHQVEEGLISSNQAGTGIGLSLTKELVELMHGKISVESEPGLGSKFTIRIPLGKEHLKSDEYVLVSEFVAPQTESTENDVIQEVDAENEQREHHTADSEHKPLVLVVEDHDEIRNYIAENLKHSCTIKLANNGAEGLKNAIENIPDLVITDVAMPEMEGTELCEKLKTDERTSHVPVIMLTAKSGMKDKMKGLETGADVYLTKPFNIKELRVRVQKLIEQRRNLRERFTRNIKLEPKDIAVSSADGKFIERALEIIEKNMGNSDFEVRQFQDEMFMSRMQLFRKIKALTNQTPGEFIRTIRLKRAASLLEQKFGNIAQVSFEVGFNNPSYFAKCFQEYFGVLPSDFLKKQKD